MIVRIARIVALSAAFLSLPAHATPSTHSKHKTTHHAAKRAHTVARAQHRTAKPMEVAKADPAPAAAPAEHPAYQSDDPEAAPTGSRHVVTHSIYSASAD